MAAEAGCLLSPGAGAAGAADAVVESLGDCEELFGCAGDAVAVAVGWVCGRSASVSLEAPVAVGGAGFASPGAGLALFWVLLRLFLNSWLPMGVCSSQAGN